MAIVEVVKYNGSPDVFAWKYPSEELGTWTQLIVNESQEALLVKGGRVLDLFQAGRYTLETANIPLLNKLINLPFGGRSPFSAEVWFINKQSSLDIKWGTASPIQLQDPKYAVFVPIRSYGQFGIRIADSRSFLTKLIGTMSVFDKGSVLQFFRGLYLTMVKDAISSYLVEKRISILEISAYLEELSTALREKMQPVLAEYGIELLNFYVNDISMPEEDEAVQQLKAALAKRAEMDILGYDYRQERSFDTLQEAAKNPGTPSSFIGAGLGLGMGAAVGGAVGQQFRTAAKALDPSGEETKTCPACGAAMLRDHRFCAKCGCDTERFSRPAGASAGNCPHCGAALPAMGAKFCPACGKALNRLCPVCQTPVVGSAKFCPECGAKLE